MKNRNISKLLLFIFSLFSLANIGTYAIPPLTLVEGTDIEAIVTEEERENYDIGVSEIKSFGNSGAAKCRVKSNNEVKFFKSAEHFDRSYKNNIVTLQLYSLFGNGDLIARSEFCDITCKDGDIVHGILMDHALGQDYLDLIYAVKKLYKKAKRPIPIKVDKHVQQKYYNLIWLDLLALQYDRQLINMFFEYIIAGNNIYFTNIQGIDNDNAFYLYDSKKRFNELFYGLQDGLVTEQTPFLPVFKYIDADLYKKFMTISEEEIASSTSSILTPAQVEETIDRFRMLKNYLLTNKDIKIITEEGWNEETLEALSRSHVDKRYLEGLLSYSNMRKKSQLQCNPN